MCVFACNTADQFYVNVKNNIAHNNLLTTENINDFFPEKYLLN